MPALRELRAALPSGVEVYAGGVAAREFSAELERAGVRCPPDLRALRSELRRRSRSS